MAITVRSLIAPGYMLDTENSNGFGWNIILCNGLNAVNAISGIDQVHTDHTQHIVLDNETNTAHNDHETHEEDHFSVACGLWSSSTIFISDTEFDTSYLAFFRPENFAFQYTSKLTLQSIYNNRLARGPPV